MIYYATDLYSSGNMLDYLVDFSANKVHEINIDDGITDYYMDPDVFEFMITNNIDKKLFEEDGIMRIYSDKEYGMNELMVNIENKKIKHIFLNENQFRNINVYIDYEVEKDIAVTQSTIDYLNAFCEQYQRADTDDMIKCYADGNIQVFGRRYNDIADEVIDRQNLEINKLVMSHDTINRLFDNALMENDQVIEQEEEEDYEFE